MTTAERLARIEERLDNFIDESRRERETSLRERAEVEHAHREIAKGLQLLNDSVRACMNEVQVTKGELKDIKPVIDDFKEKRAEGRGMIRLANAARLLFAGAAGWVASRYGP